MFTGIVENLGKVISVQAAQNNLQIRIESSFADELKIDQSVAHNGVCLTVVAVEGNQYEVTAVEETLLKTNLLELRKGDLVNLERAMKMNARLDGHIVQGHVDQTAKCIEIEDKHGSIIFTFEYEDMLQNITIEKGSITVNGVSLTVVNSQRNQFSVTIIPYTYEHTNFHLLKIGDTVNLEFDVIGKYVARLFKLNIPKNK